MRCKKNEITSRVRGSCLPYTRLLTQIADGIRYLHSLFIIHRDIKPSNVLVWSLHPDKEVDVRLADYGVSQFSTPSGLWRHKGTEEYMAPELFKSHRNQAYDEKVGREEPFSLTFDLQ